MSLARTHQWCSDNSPALGTVLHARLCLSGMLTVFAIGGLVTEAKGYINLLVN